MKSQCTSKDTTMRMTTLRMGTNASTWTVASPGCV
jgi:hypothetical protein